MLDVIGAFRESPKARGKRLIRISVGETITPLSCSLDMHRHANHFGSCGEGRALFRFLGVTYHNRPPESAAATAQ